MNPSASIRCEPALSTRRLAAISARHLTNRVPLESYTCFFTSPPFWTDSIPTIPADIEKQQYIKLMSEILFDRAEAGIRIRVARDGLIEIRDANLEQSIEDRRRGVWESAEITAVWARYLSLINSFALCLELGCMATMHGTLFDFQEVTINDLNRHRYTTDGQFKMGDFAMGAASAFYLHGRYTPEYGKNTPTGMDQRFVAKVALPVEAIETAFNYFKRIIVDGEFLDCFHTLAKAYGAFKIADFKNSVVLCWFVLERCLNGRYEEHLKHINDEAGGHRIPPARMKFLDGRDFTSAIISQILELTGAITFGDLDRLDDARRLRNDIAHHLQKKEATQKSTHEILTFTLEFLAGHILPSDARFPFWPTKRHEPML